MDGQRIKENDLMTKILSLENEVSQLKQQLAEVIEGKNRVAIVVFSGDLDRVLAAMIIATGAATFGKEVSLFFTFWGINSIRKRKIFSGKKWHQKLFALLNPDSYSNLPVSKMNFF
ncbi:MAG: DsrE/DsrF/DrsH-like family protein, partial [Sulfurihydrogenibium azorense]